VQGLGRRCVCVSLAFCIRDVWVDSSVVLPVLGQTPKRVLRDRATPILEGEGLDPAVCLQTLEVLLGVMYCCWRQTPAE